VQVNNHENGVPPSWTTVERVVAMKGGDGSPDSSTKYLVKWEVLGYQDCTWEDAEDLKSEEVCIVLPHLVLVLSWATTLSRR
jgi:hypothetical protein